MHCMTVSLAQGGEGLGACGAETGDARMLARGGLRQRRVDAHAAARRDELLLRLFEVRLGRSAGLRARRRPQGGGLEDSALRPAPPAERAQRPALHLNEHAAEAGGSRSRARTRGAHCPSMPGIVLTFCAQGSADVHQMRRRGGNWAFCSRQPILSE